MTGSSLPVARVARQVAAVLLERLVRALRVGAGHALAAAHLLQRGQDLLVAGTGRFQDALRVASGLRRSEEQMLGRDVFILEPLGLVLGVFEQLPGARIDAH